MKATILGLAVMLSAGCYYYDDVDNSKVVPAPEHADEAEKVVFDFYRGSGMAAAPTLFYYGGAALDCRGNRGFRCLGTCCDGQTVGDTSIILSNCGEDWDGRFSVDCWGAPGSTIAHEMAHALSLQTGGDGCGDHNCTSFAPGGLVEQATALLVAKGL